MENVLDNPAWNALISGNRHLSFGSDQVRYFDKEVSPFAAFTENTIDNFRLLYELLPHNNPVLFVTPVETEIPMPWKVLQLIQGLQMVYDTSKTLIEASIDLTPLTHQHVPQMVALAKLTNPGPFAERTINFGHYMGVFENENLVAMAGQRLHPFNYAEISAVCTHPDHTGRGYARQLLLHQVNRIKAKSEIPYLHVRHDNDRAIKVYESLGFNTRRQVYFYVMKKNDTQVV
ncbi:MAG TPA: GNAT family N-acetyltransferase [Mucilaginibacter sp.]|jgi:predicted GNAT family acetyltransferase